MNTGKVWLLIAVCAFGLAGMTQARTEMSVQVREGQLRDRPSFLGTIVASVDYGDRVQVEREQGPWRYVAHGNQAGWIHESALTRKRIVLAAGDEDAAEAATEQEMALAGKGFSAEVEGEFRAKHGNIDFSWVDHMETLGKEPERLTQFLKQGGVYPAQEGGR